MSENKKKLFTAKHIANGMRTAWEATKQDVQNVLDKYNALGLPQLTADEFDRLFTDTEVLIFDKITGGDMHLAGTNGTALAVNKKQALNMLDKPAGFDALMYAVNNITEAIKANEGDNMQFGATVNREGVAKAFKVDENGNLQYETHIQERIDNAGKCFCTTEQGAAILAFNEQVAAAFYANGLDKLFPVNNTSGSNPDLLIHINRVLALIQNTVLGYYPDGSVKHKNQNGARYQNDGTLGYAGDSPTICQQQLG